MSTLFSDDSTISEEDPIDYENKVAIYDDYYDDMYAIKNNKSSMLVHHEKSVVCDGYMDEFIHDATENIEYEIPSSMIEQLLANPYAGDGTGHPDMHLIYVEQICYL